jgi:hypothetical protein
MLVVGDLHGIIGQAMPEISAIDEPSMNPCAARSNDETAGNARSSAKDLRSIA